MNGLNAKIAFRGFFSTKGTPFISFTAWITLCGVAMGVMSLVVVMAVMNGFGTELRKNIVDSQSHILLYRRYHGIENWRKMKTDIAKVDPSIRGVLPITYNEVLFVHRGRVQGGILEGVEADEASMLGILVGKKLLGPRCYIGEELALKLGVGPGQKIKVVLPTVVEKKSTQIFELEVAGIFETGYYEYSSRYIYADLSYIQEKLGWQNRVAAFRIRIDDPENAAVIAKKIRLTLSFPFFVRTWMNISQNLFLAIQIQKVVMAIILVALIGVALFNVISSLIMIVIQKTKEISILKALGMKKANIQKIFLLQGLFMGGIGTVIGLILGGLICMFLSHFHLVHLSPEIYYLSYLPVEIRLLEVLTVCGGMIFISLFASFFPAKKAASLVPVEGIRYE